MKEEKNNTILFKKYIEGKLSDSDSRKFEEELNNDDDLRSSFEDDFFEYYIRITELDISSNEANIASWEYFNKQIHDPDFNKRFKAYKLLIKTFNEIGRRELKEELNKIYDELSNNEIIEKKIFKMNSPAWLSSTNYRLQRVFAIAAILIGVIVTIGIWQPTKVSNENIYKEYAVTYPNDFKINNNNTPLVRGDECVIENLTSDECEKVSLALYYYDKEKYSDAEKLFSEVLSPLQKNYELAFFMSVSQLKSNNTEKAITNFSLLCKLKDYKYTEESNYYLALSYIKNNERSKAREILESLTKEEGKYYNQASEILSKLRWF